MSFAHRSNPIALILAALAVLGAAQWACAQPLPCRYEVAAVIQAPPGPVGSSPTFGNAISPNGRYIVGSYRFDAVAADKAYYFDMQTQQFTPLPLLPGTFTSQALDVNDAGQIAGKISIPAGDKGFVYSIKTAQYTLLEPIHPQGVCEATGINSQGVVCGTRSIGSKSDPVFPKTAFIWSPGAGFVDLGEIDSWGTFAADIAEDGLVAAGVGFGLGAHWWDGENNQSVGTFKGADGLTPLAIADSRHVVGSALFIQGPAFWSEAFEFRDLRLVRLPVLDEVNRSCTAMGVGPSGIVVGGCRPPTSGNWKPCLWFDERIIDFQSFIDVPPSLRVDTASAVSDLGRIVCGARLFGSTVAVVFDPATAIAGDTNCDDRVDVDDLIVVILDWGSTRSLADVTHDGVVNVEDLILVIESWTF